jgi:hypothetical protein
MNAITASASAISDPSPVESNATRVPAVRMQMVAILKRVMCASSGEKAEPGLFQDCFVLQTERLRSRESEEAGLGLHDSETARWSALRQPAGVVPLGQ